MDEAATNQLTSFAKNVSDSVSSKLRKVNRIIHFPPKAFWSAKSLFAQRKAFSPFSASTWKHHNFTAPGIVGLNESCELPIFEEAWFACVNDHLLV